MSNSTNIPSTPQLVEELNRERYKQAYRRALRSTLYVLIIVAAIAVLISTLLFPVLQVSGESMTPTLNNGEIVVLVKTNDFRVGDLCCFTWNNRTLIKRVIATQGDWIKIDNEGTVYVNEQPLEEPYLVKKSLGECDLAFPYQVPENSFFAMGDHRETSIDSRSSAIGSVNKDQIIGKVWFRLYPVNQIGFVNKGG